MKESTRKMFHWERDFGRTLVRVALPIALQNLVAASAHIVDGLMVAGLGDAHYAAVTQAGRYSFLFQLFLFGAASGSSIFISQFWGKKDVQGIRKVMSLCWRITVGLALLFMLGALLLPRPIMSLFLQEGESRELAIEYISWGGLNYLFASIDIVFSNTLRATGKPVVAMTAGIAGILTNTLANYTLIYGHFGFPALGVKGAAMATVLAAAVSLAVNVGYTYKRRQPGAIRMRDMRMPGKSFTLGYIKRVLPVVVNEGMWSLGVTTYAVFYGMRGDTAVNAIGVYNNVDQLMTVLLFGVVNAASIMIGNSIGAGDRDRAILTSRRMLLAVEGLAAVTGVLLIVLSAPILSFFNRLSPETLDKAAIILLIAGCMLPFRFFNTINIVGVLRAGGDTIFSMILDAGSVWIIGVPCVALATVALGLPIEGIFLFSFIEELFKICVGLPRFLSNKWINNLTTIGKEAAP
ncbi:MAG: MATE family efflux transporter [Clostridia bacterium]|nr:MATE family efflux transporter [Clostridia bacterium]